MKTVKITKSQVNFLLEKINEVENSLNGIVISGKISYFLNRNKNFTKTVVKHFENDRINLLRSHIVFKDDAKTIPLLETKDVNGNIVDNEGKVDSDFDSTFTHSYVFENKELEDSFTKKIGDLLKERIDITLYTLNVDNDIIDNTCGEHERLDNLWNLIDLINTLK